MAAKPNLSALGSVGAKMLGFHALDFVYVVDHVTLMTFKTVFYGSIKSKTFIVFLYNC